jgi:predicted porin
MSSNGYLLGLTVPVGAATKILAQAMFVDPKKVLAANEATVQIYNLGVQHSLSKRTELYAIGGYARNWNFVDGQKARALAVGMRHSF